MEQFSKAYVKAIASVADCNVTWSDVDYDSVDGTLRRRTTATVIRSPILDAQLKATYRDCYNGNDVIYDLKLKNYDELRSTNIQVPRILIVVVLPDDLSQWTLHSENELLVRKCGYWKSLRGFPASQNQKTERVTIPRSQLLDVDGLDKIFQRLEQGQLP